MMVDQAISDRLESVREKGRQLLAHHRIPNHTVRGGIEAAPFMEWHAQSVTVLESLFGPNHTYVKNFVLGTTIQGIGAAYPGHVEQGLGILDAVAEDLARGWTWQLKEMVHAELFDNFLAMAEHLLNNGGYKDAAAVIAGGVLEEHLRKLSQKNGLAPQDSVSAMNDALRQQGAYNQIAWRSVQGWYDIRTNAAHAHYDQYDHRQVAQMIDGIRGFIDRHPA